MPFLLLFFLTLACLPELDSWPGPLIPAPPGVPPVLWSLFLTWGSVAALGAHAWWAARRTRLRLEHDLLSRDRVLYRYEKGRFWHQMALFGVYTLALCVFGWGAAINQLWRTPDLGTLPLAELMLLTPFLVGMVLSWWFFYDADRAAHLSAHRLFGVDTLVRAFLQEETTTATAPPVPREFGSRWFYVGFQLRQKLVLVFIPVVLMMAQKELQRWLGTQWVEAQRWLNVAGLFLVAGIFLGMPLVVRLVLGLKPLPPGPLRDRLEAAAKRVGFKCSDILVWNTRSGMANAMVVGLLPWLRYVVFTDRMLEEFTPAEVEAVFGHEAGHVKHHHMLYYLGFLLASVAVLGAVAHLCLPAALAMEDAPVAAAAAEAPEVVPDPAPAPSGWWGTFQGVFRAENFRHLEGVPLALAILVYIFIVFGFLSRRCERQADIYGCRVVSCGRADCPGHEFDEREPLARGLCRTGIRTFILALEKVALLNGISRDKPGFLQSWQHSTIAKRVAFLESLIDNPRLEPEFQRRVVWMKVSLLAVLFVTLGTLLAWPG